LVNEDLSLMISFLEVLDLLQEWCWVLDQLGNDQDDELCCPDPSSEFKENSPGFSLVLFCDHLGHFDVTLGLDSTDIPQPSRTLANSVANSQEEPAKDAHVDSQTEIDFFKECKIDVDTRNEEVAKLGNLVKEVPPLLFPIDHESYREAH